MLRRRAIQGLVNLSVQVEIPPTRHGSVKTSRNRLPYPVAGCFIFPRLYLTSVRFLRIMKSDPTREDGYWRMWENATPSVDLFGLSTHVFVGMGGGGGDPMFAYPLDLCFIQSISFSLLCNSPKSCRCLTRFIEFGPFRASLTKIAGK